MAFSGDFTPVLAKYSKSFSLIDCISVGVDRMQRNFEPTRKQLETWQRSELTDVSVKVVICAAFVEGQLDAPKHLARTVHDLYFEPVTSSHQYSQGMTSNPETIRIRECVVKNAADHRTMGRLRSQFLLKQRKRAQAEYNSKVFEVKRTSRSKETLGDGDGMEFQSRIH
jgi:hypothetical protein